MMQSKEKSFISVESVKRVMKLMYKIYKYKDFFSVKGFFSECFSHLVENIDKAVEEYIAQNSDRNLNIAVLNNGNDEESISSIQIERTIEFLTEAERERRHFLGNFPIWRDYRQETIKCLREIAEELQRVEDHTNRLNVVASVSGLTAGLINVTKNVKEYIPVPEYVQKAAPVLSAINGLIRSYTSTTCELNLERLSEKTEKVINIDKRQFQVMMHWFEYNAKLMDSVKSAIGSQLYELIFGKLKTFYYKIKSSDQQKEENWKKLFEAMVEFLVKEGHCISLAVPIAAVSLKLFIAFSSALLSLDWPDAACYVSRITNYSTTMVYGAHAGLAAKELYSSDEEASSNAGTCVGIILDMGPAILDLSRLVKTDATNEQAANINKIADTIEEEIGKIEYVYKSLNSE